MKKPFVVLSHVLLWLFLYALIVVIFSLLIATSGVEWLLSGQTFRTIILLMLPAVMLPFYAFYFLYPKLIRSTNKWLWYALSTAIILIMPVIYLKLDDQPITKILYHNTFLLFGFFPLLGFLFRSFLSGISDRQIKNELQRKQVESELRYLKAQVNPHFLFNTLNNIDSLISSDPGLASKSLINLSDVMRYMIYESTENMVLLQKELDYLGKVVTLNKLRFKAEKQIIFHINGEASEYRIPPLLLLPVIENVFKHQSSKQNNEAIIITVTIDKEWLTLTTSNPYDQTAKTTAEGGFGIETLRRRLDLLFKDRYDFEVVPAAPIFKVTLRIPLV